jgi:hypothetical protein
LAAVVAVDVYVGRLEVGGEGVDGVDDEHDPEEDAQVLDGFEVEIGRYPQIMYVLDGIRTNGKGLILHDEPTTLAEMGELLLALTLNGNYHIADFVVAVLFVLVQLAQTVGVSVDLGQLGRGVTQNVVQ